MNVYCFEWQAGICYWSGMLLIVFWSIGLLVGIHWCLAQTISAEREERREAKGERIFTIVSKSHGHLPVCQLDYKKVYSQMREKNNLTDQQTNKQ